MFRLQSAAQQARCNKIMSLIHSEGGTEEIFRPNIFIECPSAIRNRSQIVVQTFKGIMQSQNWSETELIGLAGA